MNPKINWNYPTPRSGWRGQLDAFIGPGVARAELALELGVSLIGGLSMLIYAFAYSLAWNGWQIALAVLLAFDLAGGVVTNATSTAKRWYHRPGQGFRQHFTFIAVHGIHLALVAWAFRAGDWAWAIGWYAFLMCASLFILRIPLYLRRPVAFSIFGLGLLLAQYLDAPVPGLEWFIPVFLLKLLLCHLLREEPYRPDQDSENSQRKVKSEMFNIEENERLEIRHQSQGCFHHYEDVFEIFGNAPSQVQVYRLQPSGKGFELEVVEKKGTVQLTENHIEQLGDLIAQYREIAQQKDTPPPSIVSTTEDTICLTWYRDGEIFEEISVHQEHEMSLPVLRALRSEAK